MTTLVSQSETGLHALDNRCRDGVIDHVEQRNLTRRGFLNRRQDPQWHECGLCHQVVATLQDAQQRPDHHLIRSVRSC